MADPVFDGTMPFGFDYCRRFTLFRGEQWKRHRVGSPSMR
jgi:hypothetical protein